MRKSLLLVVMVVNLLTVCSYSQEIAIPSTRSPQESHDFFMRKSRNNRTAGWILAGTGSALILTGTLIAYGEALDAAYTGEESSASGVVAGIGLVAGVLSIPCFINAGRNKKKAKLALSQQPVSLGFYRTQRTGYHSIGVKIDL
jgi:hypothetical protein